MPQRRTGRSALVLGFSIALGSCGGPASPPKATPTPYALVPRDSIPPENLGAVIDAHYRGLGAMERYEYAKAADAFREVVKLAPGWIPGNINLAIALLNQGGAALVDAKKNPGSSEETAALSNLDAAVQILGKVIAAHPENPTAHFCRGMVLNQRGDVVAAHADFRKVVEIDPGDAHAWLEVATTLTDPEQGDMPANRRQARELIDLYSKALERNPYLITATYKLAHAYRYAGDSARQGELLREFLSKKPEIHPSATGEQATLSYGEAGRYSRIIEPFPRPRDEQPAAPRPRFGAPAGPSVELPSGHRWAKATDLTGPLAVLGRARGRFGVGMAAFDADGDGDLDLYLTASVVGPKGVRDALFLSEGAGRFRDVTAAFGLPDDRAGLGVVAGDFDADRRLDLFLTGVGDNRLYRNVGGSFEDRTAVLGQKLGTALSPTARWLDIDQDGDLDLYVVNYCEAAAADRAFTGRDEPPGIPNVAYRNDGEPGPIGTTPEITWVPLGTAPSDTPATQGLSIAFSTGFPGIDVLGGGTGRHTAVAALDVDEDRDIDLVLGGDEMPPSILLNDRSGAFQPAGGGGFGGIRSVDGLLVTDLDKDGKPDLVALGSAPSVSAWRNATTRDGSSPGVAWEPFPVDARGWISATAFDLDLDTWPDLVGLPGPGSKGVMAWARDSGRRFEAATLPLPPDGSGPSPASGFLLADVVGDALPELIVMGAEGPRIYPNLGNGNHWLGLDLGGRWKTGFDQMRTNPQAIGVRLAVEGQGIYVPYDHTTTSASLGQSVAPIVLGLGDRRSAPLLRVRWPDGVMQSELNINGDKTLALAEQSRKTGSCPVLFTWNGSRFECVGDFLGTSGLGFGLGPGRISQPDRDEAVAIDPGQLREIDGVFRLSVTEPMDEVAYLDKLTLDVVDRPPGSLVGLDERFSTDGRKASGATFAWAGAIEPAHATDHGGRDVTDLIRHRDRRTVDRFARLRGWPGYAERHALILDFEDRLARVEAGRKLRLCLDGWVEYPYSQTNYAAATAGVVYEPPTLERRRDDETWELIDAHLGFPAGLPRMMTVELDPRAIGPRSVLRISTNMECYWDRAFVAVVDDSIRPTTTALPVLRAALGDRGYLREGSPDGRMPLLYEYDHVDPAPLARMEGMLTRYGDVARLLRDDDDQLCLVGSGDEVRIEFDARLLPPLAQGWTRSYVLRTFGYCKDADPFTATSDTVGPLPWKGMGPYPFGPGGARPTDPDYERYLLDYQTRPAGLR